MNYLILITPTTATKAAVFLTALYEAGKRIGIEVRTGAEYSDCDVLILYGLGGADRIDIAAQHGAEGKTFVTWDLGYWDRCTVNRKFRLAFNYFHPRLIMNGPTPSGERFEAAGLPTGNAGNPAGPIMLVGNGPKSVAVGAQGWATDKLKEIRKAFPGKQVVYRPKPTCPPEITGLPISYGPIDAALHDVSLVVARHSNVAVDACRWGVPVVCDDGAAAAIYPQRLQDYEKQPDATKRMEFLHRLAYWQWSASEAQQAWTFIQGKLCG